MTNNSAGRNESFTKDCIFLNEKFQVINEFPDDKEEYLVNHFILCIANSIMILPAIFLNCISAITIFKNSQLKEKVSYFLIAVQSVVDAAIGLLALPSLVYIISSEIYGSPNCSLHFLLFKTTYLFTALSVLTLCAMTVERYFGIFRPLTHRTSVTSTRVLTGLAIGTLWPFLSITVSLKYPTFYKISSTIGTTLFLSLTTYVYGKIWIGMKSRQRKLATAVSCASQPTNLNERQRMEKETKLAKSCFLVVVCCVICLLPMSFNSVYQKLDIFRNRVAYLWSLTLIMFNSILNSLIFFWRNPLLFKSATTLACSK
jgi:hypothetical protein